MKNQGGGKRSDSALWETRNSERILCKKNEQADTLDLSEHSEIKLLISVTEVKF